LFHVYQSDHKWSRLICGAFAQGGGFPIVPPAPLRPGGVFMYGALRGLLPTLRQAQREGRTWVYGDNGYFFPGKTEQSYFRLTKNALQHNGSGNPPPGSMERAKRLGVQLKPWRTSGSHIVVCPPGHLFGATFGFSADAWIEKTLAELKKHTDRKLVVRMKVSWNDAKPVDIIRGSTGKPKTSVTTPLLSDLAGAWALVTHSSNAAVEAVVAGYPVVCTESCAASAMGTSDLSTIESPRTDGDRESWLAVLAANQWTLGEMRSGQAWAELNR
jgi:hypothetical protein